MPSNINPTHLADQLNNGDVSRISTAAFGIINSLQDQKSLLAGEFIGAITAAFILTMEASRVPTTDVLTTTRNIMADAEGRRPEFRAITAYLKKEVLA